MKFILIPATLLLSFGIAQAGPAWDGRQAEDPSDSGRNQAMQSTAVEPGIGDRVKRFDDEANHQLTDEFDDWTDLRNAAIYGSF